MDQEWHLSSGNALTVLVRIGKHSHREALDGAFAFHDGKILFFAYFFLRSLLNHVNTVDRNFVYFISTDFLFEFLPVLFLLFQRKWVARSDQTWLAQ
jgi:hypothetical protein